MYCTYMYVYVSISKIYIQIYLQILAYTSNTYKYVLTYRIRTLCKCTYSIVFCANTTPTLVYEQDTYKYVQHGSLMIIALTADANSGQLELAVGLHFRHISKLDGSK